MLYTIRTVEEQDIPFLWEMLYESLYVPEGHPPFRREILREPDIAKYVEGWGREGDLGYIAVNDKGEPLGSVTLRYFDQSCGGFGYVGADVPELGMALKAEYRGQGIGKALLKRLFEELSLRKVQKVSLSVDPDNPAAVKLYKRFGFKQIGIVGTSITMIAEIE
ncbi:GNAT family N-acetyltransferase [Paenibacillus albidus]|uniref:GNAT family N-acetyltransferase n=1 Tax=Paenibacillus albidus TaxID=2041023 RepID=UPI001BE877B6|nr:GNAT family N-acetyltransferase [Paenibacillus albidus]MBT2292962.1 GNAT family N-acetyltransferase [Paenibacillus albidus]